MLMKRGAALNTIPAILLDTDIGNDIDDVLALAMLCRLHKDRIVRLIGISVSNGCVESALYTSVFLQLFGISVPIYRNEKAILGDPARYLHVFRRACVPPELAIETDVRTFIAKLISTVDTFRIVGIGFSTNLVQIIEELKSLNRFDAVGTITLMAGNFRWKMPEFNVASDPAAFAKMISYDRVISFCDYSVGSGIYFDGSIFEQYAPIDNPIYDLLRATYLAYRPMPYDRPTWDPCTVLFSLRDRFEGFFREVPIRYNFDRVDKAVVVDADGKHKGIVAAVERGAAHKLKNEIYKLSLGVQYKFECG
jgi:inosine-uridine nucleoside N-ribohydrolase